MEKNLRGRKGEELAVEWLKNKDMDILHRNWRSGRYEIDIVARKENLLVFVEVKTRVTRHFGDPLEMVKGNQRNRIIKAANQFVSDNNEKNCSIRFDVVSVIDAGSETDIEYIEDAFFPLVNRIKI